ncbi:hypothetical protein QBC47DRAFT_392983 [Echria macrotheca]|uniref:Uncharacterized protein n=1 Tax=Echria macrotheca TaxID=438768 RepID=A0AAJ0F196_9PEZI|nr:hypothetical protein QBC47DRAFT_392983 [Echria macrotheca]
MSPQQPQVSQTSKEPEPVQLRSPQTTPPSALQPMDPQRPHPESDVGLRGGYHERRGPCPGRFCFIIPCPLPCDCCII